MIKCIIRGKIISDYWFSKCKVLLPFCFGTDLETGSRSIQNDIYIRKFRLEKEEVAPCDVRQKQTTVKSQQEQNGKARMSL